MQSLAHRRRRSLQEAQGEFPTIIKWIMRKISTSREVEMVHGFAYLQSKDNDRVGGSSNTYI